MIICICNAINDKDIKQACTGKVGPEACAEDVLSTLGRKPVCGQCLCMIDEMVGQAGDPLGQA